MKKLVLFIFVTFSILASQSLNKVESSTISKEVSNEIKIKDISSNLWATYFLDENGAVWVIGDNRWMIFGKTKDYYISKPLKIMEDVKEVYPRQFSTVMLKKDDSLWVVGGNNFNDLGIGDVYSIETPVQIMKNVKKLFKNESNLVILKKDKSLWVTGSNYQYKLGIGETQKAYTPTKIAKNVKDVVFGNYCTMIIQEDGTLLGMGSNINGQLGTGDNEPRTIPTFITSNVENVYCNFSSSFIFKKDGSLWETPYFNYSSTNSPKKSLKKVSENILATNYNYGFLLFLKADKSLWKEKNEYDYQNSNDSSNNFIKILDDVDKINPYILKDSKELDFYYSDNINPEIKFTENIYGYNLYVYEYILKRNGDLVFGDKNKFVTGNVKNFVLNNNFLYILKFDGTIWKIDIEKSEYDIEKFVF